MFEMQWKKRIWNRGRGVMWCETWKNPKTVPRLRQLKDRDQTKLKGIEITITETRKNETRKKAISKSRIQMSNVKSVQRGAICLWRVGFEKETFKEWIMGWRTTRVVMMTEVEMITEEWWTKNKRVRRWGPPAMGPSLQYLYYGNFVFCTS